MQTYKGLQLPPEDVNLNIGDVIKVHSNFVGAVSPDHTTFEWSRDQMSGQDKDASLRNLISRRFMSTASTPMRHTFSGDFGIQQWGAPDYTVV